jgi:hypothetical protein
MFSLASISSRVYYLGVKPAKTSHGQTLSLILPIVSNDKMFITKVVNVVKFFNSLHMLQLIS